MKTWLTDENGMTLIELMAAMALAVILMTAAAGIYIYTGNVFGEAASADDLNRTTQAVSDFMEERLCCVSALEISMEEQPEREGRHELLFTTEGRIVLDGEDVYYEAFYNDRKVFCQIERLGQTEPGYVLKYRILWKDRKNITLYSRESVVKLVNLELTGENILYQEEVFGIGSSEHDLYFYYDTGGNSENAD